MLRALAHLAIGLVIGSTLAAAAEWLSVILAMPR